MSQDCHLLIDPDGTADPGLVVLIAAPTGVFYETHDEGMPETVLNIARRQLGAENVFTFSMRTKAGYLSSQRTYPSRTDTGRGFPTKTERNWLD